MPILTIHHKTEYRYAHPVAFGEHRIMLRPLPGHDLRILSNDLRIEPQPMSLRWIHDVFGNSVAIATFDQRADRLTFTATATVEHSPAEEFALTPDDEAWFYPFIYGDEEFPDLVQFVTPQYGDPNGELSAWARQFLNAAGPTPTFSILSGMTHNIRETFAYRRRHERGTQHPLDTLQFRSGSCRDYALFMIEALRRLGIAARFVSGYLFVPGDGAHGYVGGGSTHAWVQVYLPSAGWIEFDPTNGIVGTRDLIRVAVARDPRQAIPLHGTYLGSTDSFVGMDIDISVVPVGEGRAESLLKRSEELLNRQAVDRLNTEFGKYHRCGRGVAANEADLKRMEIKVGFEIAYAAESPTPMVIMLCIHPSRFSDIVGAESIIAEPDVPIGFYRDSFGNVCGRLTAPAGGITLRGSALVRDSGLPDAVVPAAQQIPIDQLPDDLLFYLMPSRYCETDKLTDIAWSLFGNTPPGWQRVQAIVDFVHQHVSFGYEHAHHMKSAHDVYEQGAGVCRDFAHLALTFCRCMGMPARYCTGYMGDIGVPRDPAPMDFHGWFQVYLSGQWYTFDARHNQPRIGRILMATGRDAADVALTTSFGRMTLTKFFVVSEEVVLA